MISSNFNSRSGRREKYVKEKTKKSKKSSSEVIKNSVNNLINRNDDDIASEEGVDFETKSTRPSNPNHAAALFAVGEKEKDWKYSKNKLAKKINIEKSLKKVDKSDVEIVVDDEDINENDRMRYETELCAKLRVSRDLVLLYITQIFILEIKRI